MTSNEINDKTRLIELTNTVREKFNKYRHGEDEYAKQMERKYKPLVKLQKEQLNSNLNSSTLKNVLLANLIFTQDTISGLKHAQDGTYTLGGYPVEFIGDKKIKVINEEYDATKGLVSLLTSKVPQNYTHEDIESYKQMLIATSAHLRKNDGQIKSCRGAKSKFVPNLFHNACSSDDVLNSSQSISSENLNLVTKLLKSRFNKESIFYTTLNLTINSSKSFQGYIICFKII